MTPTTNSGGAYRTGTGNGVDLKPIAGTTGQYRVSDGVAGEWIEYSVNVATAGQYTVEFRVGHRDPGSTFHLESLRPGGVAGEPHGQRERAGHQLVRQLRDGQPDGVAARGRAGAAVRVRRWRRRLRRGAGLDARGRDANADANSNTDTDPDSDAHSDPDSDPHAHADAHADADGSAAVQGRAHSPSAGRRVPR